MVSSSIDGHNPCPFPDTNRCGKESCRTATFNEPVAKFVLFSASPSKHLTSGIEGKYKVTACANLRYVLQVGHEYMFPLCLNDLAGV